jgi:hypothetical protein
MKVNMVRSKIFRESLAQGENPLHAAKSEINEELGFSNAALAHFSKFSSSPTVTLRKSCTFSKLENL